MDAGDGDAGWAAGRTEAVALGDAVFVLGGFGEFGYCDDCWASRDGGGTWGGAATPLVGAAACTRRAASAARSTSPAATTVASAAATWASVDGARWSRLCHRAPWVRGEGHAVVAAGACLALVGGEGGGGAGESLGDCWTSRTRVARRAVQGRPVDARAGDDGASWALVAFGLTPVHAHAAVADRGDAPRVLVFGGATRDRDDGAGERTPRARPDDAFAVRLRRARARRRGRGRPSSRSPCAPSSAPWPAPPAPAALGEVQRGNRQLVRLVRRAERCDGVDRALRATAADLSSDAPVAAPAAAADTAQNATTTTSAAAAAESVGAHLVAAAAGSRAPSPSRPRGPAPTRRRGRRRRRRSTARRPSGRARAP